MWLMRSADLFEHEKRSYNSLGGKSIYKKDSKNQTIIVIVPRRLR